jgi:hypothetical protein
MDWESPSPNQSRAWGVGTVADASTVVSGQTLSKWSQVFWQTALQQPAGAGLIDGPADQSFNAGKMFFINDMYSAVIHVPAYQPVLLTTVGAWDTEGPGLQTIPNFVEDGRGSYSDEARYVTNLAQSNIYNSYATLTALTGPDKAQTLFNISLQGADAADAGVQTRVFALGDPVPGGYIDNILQSNDLLPLDPSIANLPYTRTTGDYIEINGLKPGVYALNAGGGINASVDPVTGSTVVGSFSTAVKDILIVS